MSKIMGKKRGARVREIPSYLWWDLNPHDISFNVIIHLQIVKSISSLGSES